MEGVVKMPFSKQENSRCRSNVIIVGGGLAGLAAATALVDSGCAVTILEGRRYVGGRAASFEDPVVGGLVDACQHVAMGCCTNFLSFCKQTGIVDFLRCDRTLFFIGPDGSRTACTPSRLLPAPLHLVPLMFNMNYFSMSQRIQLGVGMMRLARLSPNKSDGSLTAVDWLKKVKQPSKVVDYFWRPVLESALGENIDLVSVHAAQKVVVDGFLAHRTAADLYVPTLPLGELFGNRVAQWLTDHNVVLRTSSAVTEIRRKTDGQLASVVCGDEEHSCDAMILAVPWRQAGRLLPDLVPRADDSLTGSPITAIHLWFDKPVIDLPHAVFLGFTSQWVFQADASHDAESGYCQVVISASRGLFEGDRNILLETVVDEIRSVFPKARNARLLNSRIVTDPTAVLSVRPGVDSVRPEAKTSANNIFLAGDWTATGWPSTMEGAVRSGRLAAQSLKDHLGLPCEEGVENQPKNLLVRFLLGR